MKDDSIQKENSFRSILKGTSIFGGVQVFNILISAIRMKLVAVILGPSGIGVAGIFNTASLTIQQFASLGLNLAVVKEIGASKNESDKLGNLLTAVRTLALITALTGALICIFFPRILSRFSFGEESYSNSFMLLAAAVFFSIVGTALMSVLQGLHEVNRLSKASLIGSTVGLLIGVPMYWLWGTDGIVPAMVVLSLSTGIWYFISLKKSLTTSSPPWKREIHLPILRKILMMGLILMSNDLFRNIASYMIIVYVRSAGGMDDVGFYQSCNTMTSQYSAIVFTAMAMDYLPRLSAAAGSNAKMCEVVNRQIEVVGLMIAPVVCTVILLAPWVIEVLQTSEFIVATPLLRLLALSVAVRALMYPLGYIVFAKDNRKLFFWMESVGANVLTFVLTCSGYHFAGLAGLGFAAISDCTICLLIYVLVNHKLYGYKMTGRAIRIVISALAASTIMTLICFFTTGITMIISSVFTLAIICSISLRSLLKLWKKQ